MHANELHAQCTHIMNVRCAYEHTRQMYRKKSCSALYSVQYRHCQIVNSAWFILYTHKRCSFYAILCINKNNNNEYHTHAAYPGCPLSMQLATFVHRCSIFRAFYVYLCTFIVTMTGQRKTRYEYYAHQVLSIGFGKILIHMMLMMMICQFHEIDCTTKMRMRMRWGGISVFRFSWYFCKKQTDGQTNE